MSLTAGPEIIFLDEPTTGLDPQSRLEMWRVTRELAGGGITIFLTTQYLEEAEHLADTDDFILITREKPRYLKMIKGAILTDGALKIFNQLFQSRKLEILNFLPLTLKLLAPIIVASVRPVRR